MFLSLSWIFSYHFHFKLTTSRNVINFSVRGLPRMKILFLAYVFADWKLPIFALGFVDQNEQTGYEKCSFLRALSAFIIFIWIGSSRAKLLNFSSKFYNFAHFSESRNFARFSCKTEFCSKNFSRCPKFNQTSIFK